jgi:hypothetical protein
LFHEGDEWALGRRVCGARGDKAVDFVEEAEGAELLASGEGPRPGEEFFEEHAEHERAFLVVEVHGQHSPHQPLRRLRLVLPEVPPRHRDAQRR